MQWHFTAGAIGTAMLSVGYLLQVAHLIRKRRSDGVSPTSYLVWALAAALVLIHEWGISEPISIFLTGFETVACLLIAGLAIAFNRGRSGGLATPGASRPA